MKKDRIKGNKKNSQTKCWKKHLNKRLIKKNRTKI